MFGHKYFVLSPKIFFVKFNIIFPQKFHIFILKCFSAMVFFLIFNISLYGCHFRLTYRITCICALQGQYQPIYLFCPLAPPIFNSTNIPVIRIICEFMGEPEVIQANVFFCNCKNLTTDYCCFLNKTSYICALIVSNSLLSKKI